MDVTEWLHGLGLEEYAPAFRDNAIDELVLPSLTAEDLKDLGVTLVGHCRRLLDTIAALGKTELAPAPSPPPATASEAERRQLTVMFCDLVGSTPLSTRFDPEDLREIIGAYHRCVIDAVGQLATPEPLNVRIGTATGLVVVGDLIGAGAAQERGVVGKTPNLAARLQALARPGTLVVADGTRRQLGTLFEIEDLGPQPLAGFAEPQPAWRVLGESGEVSRFEALRSGAAPLVGRDEELELLLRRWEQAKAGEGRVVLVSGEPGLGKSRLTAAIAERVEAEPHSRLRWFCLPHHQDSALYPAIVQLERAAGFARDDSPDEKLAKTECAAGTGRRQHRRARVGRRIAVI